MSEEEDQKEGEENCLNKINPPLGKPITFDGIFDGPFKDKQFNQIVCKVWWEIFRSIEPIIHQQFGHLELTEEDYQKIADEVTQWNQTIGSLVPPESDQECCN